MCYANNAIGISNHNESVQQNTFFRFISFKFNIVRIPLVLIIITFEILDH